MAMVYVYHKLRHSIQSFSEADDARLFLAEEAMAQYGEIDDIYAVFKGLSQQVVTESIMKGEIDKAISAVDFVNESTFARLSMQECNQCGSQWHVLYGFNGKSANIEYTGEEDCDCESDYSPAYGEPSISQFEETAKAYVPHSGGQEFTCKTCSNAAQCEKYMKTLFGCCVTSYFPA